MSAVGFRSIVHSQELSVMGFSEILGRLPRIYRAMNEVEHEVMRSKPDVMVFIDYPGFHFRLAKRLKATGIPILYYIPPKVWVWKKFRLKAMRALFSKVLCIFPFEEPFFRAAQLPTRFVGNPIVDSLPMHLSRDEARRQLGISPDQTVVTLMPGSRPAEIQKHFKIMVLATLEVAKSLQKKLKVLVPLTDEAEEKHLQSELHAIESESAVLNDRLEVDFTVGNAPVVLRASDAGLIKSGTSTLEAALMDCPHAVIYRVNALTEILFKCFVRYKGPVGLVNLMLGSLENPKRVTREILGSRLSIQDLAAELKSLLTDQSRILEMRENFSAIRSRVLIDAKESPSDRVAHEVIESAQKRHGFDGGPK